MQNPQHTYTTSGIYQICLQVKDTNACSDSICHTLKIYNTVSAPDETKEKLLYVRTINSEIYVNNLPLTGSNVIEVISINGQVLFRQSIKESNYLISLSNEYKGICFLRIINNEGVVVKKLLMN